jgi:branched-chain amino acid aminotransferase
MAVQRWRRDAGWQPLEVQPTAPLSLHPATAVLHYGQSIFEGAKAFRHENGSVHLFRVRDHAARLGRSARRMAMPDLPDDQFVDAVHALVSRDTDALGSAAGSSLYLRPFMMATDPRLGAATPPDTFLFTVIASPTPALSPPESTPALRVWVCDDYVRATPGGTGNVKTAANYALGLRGQADALAHDCDQVVWLDAAERRWVEELGAMNVFFVYGHGASTRLVTPPLGDTVLPGITRDTVIALARELSLPIVEARISVQEWQADCASGDITEVFATGTASGIKRVGSVRYGADHWTVGDPYASPVTGALARELDRTYLGGGGDWLQAVR